MTDVVLFHHVQGLTEGVRAFADRLSGGTHTVHTPDLYEGCTFEVLEEGFAFMQWLGDEVVSQRVSAALTQLPDALVYAGISWGVASAQRLAQTRPGARGALLFEACIPVTGEWTFGPWPNGVAVQIHGMDQDPFFGLEGDIEAARELVVIAGSDVAELHVYPGDVHLFTDASLPSYDSTATELVIERSRALLDRLE